jgi:hypothetical protein
MTATAARPLQELQHLLLDLISPARPVAQAQIDGLAPLDWSALLAMARQHRLGPVLYWQLARAHAGLRLPPPISAELAAGHRQATLLSLRLQGELLRVHRVLERAAIPHVALKGAFLAWHAYPEPGLRPMRDLDILVHGAQALTAYQALIAGGLSPIERFRATPQAVAELFKHLPPLNSPSGQIHVELHLRLADPGRNGEASRDWSATPSFWQRCITAGLAGDLLSFESPTDLLLHLIVHAVHEHAFNNGPLLLSDIAFLLGRQPIDWPLFWALAGQTRSARACHLALRLTERCWGAQPITWPGPARPQPVGDGEPLDTAALLMLRDFAASPDLMLHGEISCQPGWAAKARLLLRKLFPSRQAMAAMYPVQAGSPKVFLYYPVRWRRLLGQRLPGYRRNRQQSRFRQEAGQLAELRQWLARP